MANKKITTKSGIDDELFKFTRNEVIYKPQFNAFCHRILSNIKSRELKEYFNSKINQFKFNTDGTLIKEKDNQSTSDLRVRSQNSTSTKINSKQKKKRISNKRKDKIVEAENFNSANVSFLKKKTVSKICSVLEISPQRLERLISQKANYHLNTERPLSDKEWNKIQDYISNRYAIVKRHKINTNSNSSPSAKHSRKYSGRRVASSGVYGKIAKYGLGKLIYIRKK